MLFLLWCPFYTPISAVSSWGWWLHATSGIGRHAPATEHINNHNNNINIEISCRRAVGAGGGGDHNNNNNNINYCYDNINDNDDDDNNFKKKDDINN
jgi:hypothetical protein